MWEWASLPSLLEYGSFCKPCKPCKEGPAGARRLSACGGDRIALVSTDAVEWDLDLGDRALCSPSLAELAGRCRAPPPGDFCRRSSDWSPPAAPAGVAAAAAGAVPDLDMLELTVAMSGNRMHRIISSVRATGAELKSTLSSVSGLPANELLLVRAGSDVADFVGDDDRPFYGQGLAKVPLFDVNGDCDAADVFATTTALRDVWSHFDLLRVLPDSSSALVHGKDTHAVSLWELDHVQGIVASVVARHVVRA